MKYGFEASRECAVFLKKHGGENAPQANSSLRICLKISGMKGLLSYDEEDYDSAFDHLHDSAYGNLGICCWA